MQGWVKIHRELREWEWYHDSNMVHLLIHLVVSANHKPNKWKGKNIDRGQFLTGLFSLSEQTGISVRTLRTCLDRLVDCGEIDKQTTNKNTLITLLKYDKFQISDDSEEESDKQTTSKRQANDKQTTTNKNDNNSNKDNNDYNLIDLYNPTEEQINKLKEIVKKHDKPKPKKPKFPFKDELLKLGADEQHIDDWMQVRKNKKATNTKTAFDAIVKEANENNYPVAKAVQICAEKGWKGFKFQWVQNLAVDDLQKENQILKAKQENKKLKNKEHHDQRQIDMAINLGFIDHADSQTEPAIEDTDFTIL